MQVLVLVLLVTLGDELVTHELAWPADRGEADGSSSSSSSQSKVSNNLIIKMLKLLLFNHAYG